MLELLQRSGQYLYTTNYSRDEAALCKMEITELFNIALAEKHFFSNFFINPSRSPFIKKCINIMFTGENLEDIINQIQKKNLFGLNYKVSYVEIAEDGFDFKKRRSIEYEVGLSILGDFEMKHPETTFGITKLNGLWIFGQFTSNDSKWTTHNKKPFSYSNALKVNVSRAIVNIAVGNNLNCSVIDPCCGIGTVLIEALSMGINIKGYEINPSIGYNAKRNLQYFEFEDVITIGDMNTIQDKFDVAIVDLPYGIFTSISPEQQLSIIASTRSIADRMILITFDAMEEQINASGFTIENSCLISKGKFERHIYICS